MTSTTFFSKFPSIKYSNNVTTDISRRYVLLNNVFNDPFLFYPYDIVDGTRADQIANAYYGDDRLDWLVYLSNQTIDPYYDWYLQPDDLDNVLKIKYDVPNTDVLQRQVAYYRNNWYDDDNLSPTQYEGLIAESPNLIKYWEPVYVDTTNPLYYQRKQEDWIVNTNMIVRYRVTSNPQFANNEVITVAFRDANTSTGRGQVVSCNSTHVTLQHMFGNTIPVTDGGVNANSRLISEQTSANVRFTSGTLLARNIAIDEATYWSPVYIYDLENEKNEKNKSIVVIDSGYTNQILDELDQYKKTKVY